MIIGLVLVACQPQAPAAPLPSPTPPLIPTDIPGSEAEREASPQPQDPSIGITAEEPRAVTLRYVEGVVGVGSDDLFLAAEGQSLFVMEDIVTGADGLVVLELDDGTLLVLGSQSWLTLAELRGSPAVPVTRLFLNAGSLFTFREGSLPQDAIYEVGTPNAVAAIQGTIMDVQVDLALASPTILTPTLISAQATGTLTGEETPLPTLTLDFRDDLGGLADFMELASDPSTDLLATTVRTVQGSTELVSKASGESIMVNGGQVGTVDRNGNLGPGGALDRANISDQTINALRQVGEEVLIDELVEVLDSFPTPVPTPISLPPVPSNTPTPTITPTPTKTPIPAPTNTPLPTNSPPVITSVTSNQVGDVTTGITVYIDIYFRDADGNAVTVDFEVLVAAPNPPTPAVVDDTITLSAASQKATALHTSRRQCPIGVSNNITLGVTLVDKAGLRSNTLTVDIGC